MTGSRYVDWTHVHVNGDRDRAAAYVGLGRKVLGAVTEDAQRWGLQTHVMHHKTEDGAEIVGEIRGGIPRITITPPPLIEGEPPPIRGKDDFIVWARDTSHPEGIDAVHPKQILRPSWLTFFFDEDVAGYAEFQGDKGTYAGIFPEGVRFGGNIDWKNEDGERFSWYGPSSRYWVDAYRRPLAQYGKQVFCLSQPLLDVDTYCEVSDVDLAERYVLGAAVNGQWLYLVMAALEEVTWPAPPSAPTTSPDGWASPCYYDGDVSVALRRFRCIVDPAQEGPMKRRVMAGSHETLWEDSIARATAPWHFNEAGTRAVAHLPPALTQHTRRGADWTLPSASHVRVQLDIDDDEVERVDAEISMPSGDGAAALIAEDGPHGLWLVRRGRGLVYRLGTIEYPAFEVGRVDDLTPGAVFYRRRPILCADLRQSVLAVVESLQTFAGGAAPFLRFSVRAVLCQGGVSTTLAETSTIPASLTLTPTYKDVYERLAAQPVSPLALIYLHAFGLSNLGFTTSFTMGLLASHTNLPFRKGDTFGQTRISFFGGSWDVIANMVSTASNTAANQQTDFLGHTTMPGFASTGGVTAISYNTNVYESGVELVANYITGGRLPELTGVDGDNARYHPITLLGKPTPE